jgi:hypothetical protein
MADDEKERSLIEVDWPFEHRLKKPVIAHGKEVNALTFRQPHTGDMLKYGILDRTADADKTIAMMAELGSIPPSAVKLLHPADFYKVQSVLMDFFLAASTVE